VSCVGASAYVRARALGNNKYDDTCACTFGPDNDSAAVLKNHKQPVIITKYRELASVLRNGGIAASSRTSNAVARLETARTGEGRKR